LPTLAIAGIVLCLASSAVLRAQCPSAPQDHLIHNANRPTVADPADITQQGVVELEYGWERDWLPGAARGHGFSGLLKFAATCNLEVRWGTDPFLSMGGERGIGDNWLGGQYRFHHQSKRTPTLAAGYMVKIPSASLAKNLGSGRVDHEFKLLASKDVHGLHFDFNAAMLLIGRPLGSGFDRYSEITLAFSRPIHGKLGVTGAIYGDTRLNRATPGFASNLWALTYTITPRLIIDSGIDVAVTPNAPFRKRFFTGFVYSLGEVYPRIRRRIKTP